jgi:hypothetical protein
VIRRRSKLRRVAALMSAAVPSIGGLARGMWASGRGQRWLLPLAVFLAATGLVLAFAFTVEALAPFMYAIF